MSLSLGISIVDDATPFLRRVSLALHLDGVNHTIGIAVSNRLKSHFRDLDRSRPNDLGGKRTHFYSQSAKATRHDPVSDGVEVVVSHPGLAQRYFGGTIRPVNSNRLAIPARSEAYGKRPREFKNLKFVLFRSGTAALVERESTDVAFSMDRRKGREGGMRVRRGRERGGMVMFWLVDSVTQEEDKSVLPEEGVLDQVAHDASEEYIEKVAHG